MSKLNDSEYTDEILEEVWRIKDELSRKLDYDVDGILADAREKQDQSGHRLIMPPYKSVPCKIA